MTEPEEEAAGDGAPGAVAAGSGWESERDRRLTHRAMWLALVGVVVGGAIAAGASLLTAHIQVNNQNAESRRDFLRTQRQAAYGRLVADEQSHRRTLQLCRADLSIGTSLRRSQFDSMRKSLDAYQGTIASDVANVEVIASDGVFVLAQRLAVDLELVIDDCEVELGLRLAGLKPSNPQVKDLLKHAGDNLSDESSDFGTFLVLSRQDLRG